MGLIMNATKEHVHFTVFGSHFQMKPGQIKMFTDSISHYVATDRRDLGLVGLPVECEEADFMASEEGKKLIQAKTEEGVKNRIRKLKEIIYNNQVSLRRDLEQKNMKVAPETFASDGEIAAMEELARYADAEADKEAKRVEHVKKLKEKIAKV